MKERKWSSLLEESVLFPRFIASLRVDGLPMLAMKSTLSMQTTMLSSRQFLETPIPMTQSTAIQRRHGKHMYTYWKYDSDGSLPIKEFRTTWTVPPEPTSDNDQTIFLFNSIEPTGYKAIIQPVLQWGPSGAGGGAYWCVATWCLIGSNKLGFASSLTKVNPGDSLEGMIYLTGVTDTAFNYKAAFNGIKSSLITVTGFRELVYVTETLEAYSITQSSDYPSGSTSFTDIALTVTDSTSPSISWSSCTVEGFSITVEDGVVTIYYPSS
jgi:hypothetical protein